MEPNVTTSASCEYCHQALLPEYYFCPNCGNKINSVPLSASVMAQVRLYALSAVLPLICFLAISKWQGLKYSRSKDPEIKRIGIIACSILILSTVFVIWYAYVWTTQIIQSTIDSLNTDSGLINSF